MPEELHKESLFAKSTLPTRKCHPQVIDFHEIVSGIRVAVSTRKCGACMSFFAQSGKPRSGQVWPLALVLLCAIGCNRPSLDPSDQSSLQDTHQAPLQQTAAAPVTADPDAAIVTSDDHPARVADQSLSARQAANLPAGTLLTVRVISPVYADSSIASASFRGVVVDPVVVNGSTVIPGGAKVAGVVESVRASEIKPSRGYVQLTLQSVQVGGSEVSLHTASLFARPAAPQRSTVPIVRLEQGRQVTFRVSEPPSAPEQQAQK